MAAQQKVRLNKYLAMCGISSRRKADELIEEGKVQINGRRVYELGTQIDPKEDKVVVNGRVLRHDPEPIYIMFNKPKWVLTSMSDPEGRPTVGDFFKKYSVRVFPVGRLDWDSEGLLLLTNDGEFANQVMHPTEAVRKTYIAKLKGQPTESSFEKLRRGVGTAVGRVRARSVEKIQRGSEKYDWIKISISEGRNRQVRRMFEKVGCDVMKLKRVAIGRLRLGSLDKGDFRILTRAQAMKALEPDNE